MTDMELARPAQRATKLKVIQVEDCQFFVESSEGKIAYIVSRVNEDYACTCGDFTSNHKRDQAFKCKHILAVMNGKVMPVADNGKKPKLDERFISNIQGKEFVLYSGLLDLAHQKGLQKIHVEAVQFPIKENGHEAVCKAIVQSRCGDTFVEWGDSNPNNTNRKIAAHILRMAATRAKARALRDYTNIGITCLEELGDLDEVVGADGVSQQHPAMKQTARKSRKGSTLEVAPQPIPADQRQ